MPGLSTKELLQMRAKKRGVAWKYIDLPAFLKKQCIAYCTKEGGKYKTGKPNRNAIIFVFPNGVVYDIVLALMPGGYCGWRKISPQSLTWIKEHTT